MIDGFAAEILELVPTEDLCAECDARIYDVELKVLSGDHLGETITRPSCINKSCPDAQKNMAQLD